MGAEKTKKSVSCFSCRHLKALGKGTVPCKHCYSGKRYQKQTPSQQLKAQKEMALAEWRNSKKKTTNSVDGHISSDLYEAVVNKS